MRANRQTIGGPYLVGSLFLVFFSLLHVRYRNDGRTPSTFYPRDLANRIGVRILRNCPQV